MEQATDGYRFDSIFDYFDEDCFTWEGYRKDVETKRLERFADKRLLSQKPEEYVFEDEDCQIHDGRFFAEIGSAHFECFFHRGSEQGLVVFLTGARTISGGKALQKLPFFNRWSFYNYTNYSVLSIQDPMYYTFKDCKLGWYFGTKEENYRLHTSQLILDISAKLKIPSDKIILYGSSGGGTAAIEIARFIKDSYVVAINPQLDMANYPYFDGFFNDTGIRLQDYDLFNNNYDPTNTIRELDNKILILINLQCVDDFDVNLKYLCTQFNFKPRYGICSKDNLYVWLYDAVGAPNPHVAQDSSIFFSGILSCMNAIKNGVPLESINGFVRLLNELWQERFSLKKNQMELKSMISGMQNKGMETIGSKAFIIKKHEETSFVFNSNSCVIFASRHAAIEENNVSATVFLDYWSKDTSGIIGDIGKVVFKKDRLSKNVLIKNNSPFSVAFILLS